MMVEAPRGVPEPTFHPNKGQTHQEIKMDTLTARVRELEVHLEVLFLLTGNTHWEERLKEYRAKRYQLKQWPKDYDLPG